MDPATALVLFGSKDIVKKLLGPTADYLGEGLKEFTEKRIENIKSIFSRAEKKLGEKINEDGAVPPKVLKGIIEDGSYANDEITLEYYGGVLASSRSGISRDDRGATFLSLIGRLSTYQLRTHYIMYKIIRELYGRTKVKYGLHEERKKLYTYIPDTVYEKAMDFSEDENPDLLTSSALFGLLKEDLFEYPWLYAGLEETQHEFKDAREAGLLFTPSALGFELFMWSHGYSHLGIEEFIKLSFESELDNYVTINPGYAAVEEPE
ncbi:MAG: hypothetical protein IH880_08190 [Candidatus Marinimicrobia bacterium]|nr:hypothetical protein [Candidatus Neomarinimicrobiota bacterium]